MEFTILEASLPVMIQKAMDLAKEGYVLEQANMMGWLYEVRLSKPETPVKAETQPKAETQAKLVTPAKKKVSNGNKE